jgi:hypothetical protein
MAAPGRDIVDELRQAGLGRGDLVGLAVAPGVGLGLAPAPGGEQARPGSLSLESDDPVAVVGLVEEAIRPRRPCTG